jgi:hypothetical protein
MKQADMNDELTPPQTLGSAGSVSISRFRPRHGPVVLELILAIQREEFDIPITAKDQPDLQDIPSFYQTGIGDFWVAEAGNRVVGTIGLKDIENNSAALRKIVCRKKLARPVDEGRGDPSRSGADPRSPSANQEHLSRDDGQVCGRTSLL